MANPIDYSKVPRPRRIGDDVELERRAAETLLYQLRQRTTYRGGKYQPRKCRRCERPFEPGDRYATVRSARSEWNSYYCDGCADEQIELTEGARGG